MQQFDIYFSGKLLPDADQAEVRSALGKRFRLEGKALDRLFQGTPVRIKRAVDVETAGDYRARFRAIGALVDIVPTGTSPRLPTGTSPRPAQPARPATPAASGPAPKPQPQPESAPKPPAPGHPATEAAPADHGMQLLPARTGSLQDCAIEREPQPIADTDWIPLDAPGTLLDQRPPPPAPSIDTRGLSMSEARTGTLEACRVDKPAVVIGSTRWMQLDPVGVTLDQTAPAKAPDIDTAGLHMAPVGEDLDDGSTRPANRPLPDTSHLHIESA